ncbi:hypothetical protein HK099_008655 [Clydaea vesicula]|uniref:C2H2-type domain-containing protein n=1 Tax=Clydaea vesicula TaxID=447962 RepID=A0AAD5U622_9FUNG|nr:hypothetical protein HK099_008655 [Clydaea vesicula]
MKTCYYTLLEVDRLATDSDLKKAYQIQCAYEVLSDPNERTWYDSHREQILRGDEVDTEISTSIGITTEQLLRYFSSTCYKGYNDNEDGFFRTYEKLFKEIIEEEVEAFKTDSEASSLDEAITYLSFGNSTSGYDDMFYTYDKKETSVKEFYLTFQTFSSCKSFRWCDKYNLNDAPDRRVRRLIEKENLKFRSAAKKEYNNTICNLISFVKKRDPRFKKFQILQKENQELKAAQQKKKQLEESKARAEMAQQFKEQDWSKTNEEIVWDSEEEDFVIRRPVMTNNSDISISDTEEREEEYLDDFLCVACNKKFNSEQQLTNHEKSKKHIKNVAALKRQIKQQDSEFFGDPSASDCQEEKENVTITEDMTKVSCLTEYDETVEEKTTDDLKNIPHESSDADLPINSEFASVSADIEVEEEEEIDWSGKSNKNKKKTKKKEKSKAQSSIGKSDVINLGTHLNKLNFSSTMDENIKKETPSFKHESIKCNKCHECFPSKTKLFDHIKSSGHAMATENVPVKKKKQNMK